MAGEVVGWVLDHGPADFSMRAVLVTIANVARRDGTNAHPGMAAMVRGSGRARATVFAALQRLEDEGWIEITESGGGRGNATVYRVVMDRAERAERVQSRPDLFSNGNGPDRAEKRSRSRSAYLLLQQKLQQKLPTRRRLRRRDRCRSRGAIRSSMPWPRNVAWTPRSSHPAREEHSTALSLSCARSAPTRRRSRTAPRSTARGSRTPRSRRTRSRSTGPPAAPPRRRRCRGVHRSATTR